MKKIRHRLINTITTVFAGCLIIGLTACATSTSTVNTQQQQALVDQARITFESFMGDPNMAWLRENLHAAKGLLIVPNLLKAGFVFGGSGGSGVLIVPDPKTGNWSEPAFYNVGSVTFGLQIGGESAEVIMFLRTQKAVDRMLTSRFKIGGDTSIAVGPVGAGASANVMADIVSFSRSRGAFAGLSLQGAVISPRNDWNSSYFGKEVRPVDILITRSVSNPGSAGLREAVARAAKK